MSSSIGSNELPEDDVAELQSLIEEHFPGRPVLKCSAKTGVGFDALLAMLEQRGEFGRRMMEVDYDIYAEGEAELGWLNSQVKVTGADAFKLDELLMSLITGLHQRLQESNAEAAHLKVIGLCDGSYAVANVVSNATGPELSLPAKSSTRVADVVVNARVATDPDSLENLVREQLELLSDKYSLTHELLTMQSFRPGRPVPTHRITE